MNDVRDILNIKIESPYWDEAYAKALSEPAVPEWMTEAYIRALHEEKGVLPRRLDTILSVLPHAVAVPELCLLAKTLYHIIGTKKSFSEAFTEFELPKALILWKIRWAMIVLPFSPFWLISFLPGMS